MASRRLTPLGSPIKLSLESPIDVGISCLKIISRPISLSINDEVVIIKEEHFQYWRGGPRTSRFSGVCRHV